MTINTKDLLIDSDLPQCKLANAEIEKLIVMSKGGLSHDTIMARTKIEKIASLTNEQKIEMALKTFS